jgi:hypothetical protein
MRFALLQVAWVRVGTQTILTIHNSNSVCGLPYAAMLSMRFALLQVSWVRVDTQTILTIHNSIITRNQRVSLLHSGVPF